MPTQLDKLTQHIRDLEDHLQAELASKRQEFRYRLERSRVIFEDDVLARHRQAREHLLKYLSRARLGVILTAPFIYMLILPLALLDLFVSVYQAVCFPAYGIPKVPRRDFIVIDRHQLAYLNGLQKLNCVYCGYANGLIGWVREIGSRTEAYWCPIKHARHVAEPHRRYHGFIDFGDETGLNDRVGAQRKTLRD